MLSQILKKEVKNLAEYHKLNVEPIFKLAFKYIKELFVGLRMVKKSRLVPAFELLRRDIMIIFLIFFPDSSKSACISLLISIQVAYMIVVFSLKPFKLFLDNLI